MHDTGGQPGRGTEVAQTLFINTAGRRRNITWYFSRSMWILEYYKSGQITHSDRCVIRAFVARLSRILHIDIAYLRPIAPAFGARVLKTPADLHQSSVRLNPVLTHKITTDILTSSMRVYPLKWWKAAFGLSGAPTIQRFPVA